MPVNVAPPATHKSNRVRISAVIEIMTTETSNNVAAISNDSYDRMYASDARAYSCDARSAFMAGIRMRLAAAVSAAECALRRFAAAGVRATPASSKARSSCALMRFDS